MIRRWIFTAPMMLATALWMMLFVMGTSRAADAGANAITFTGKLTTGIMAIGGETTGTIISDGKTTYELDVKDAALRAKVNQLSGKQVTVKGTLTLKAGVEVGQRRIITFESLESAAARAPATRP